MNPDPLAPTVVILAAGLGTRFGGDKPFAPAGPHGEPLLAYALHDAKQAGAADAVLVVRAADAARVQAQADTLLSRILPVQVVVQHVDDAVGADPARFAARAADRTTPWGTGHAVLAARAATARAVVVLNGDDFYGADAIAAAVDFGRMLQGRARSGKVTTPTGALVGYPVASVASPNGPVNRAVVHTAADGRLLQLDEVIGLAPAGDAYEGVHAGEAVRVDPDALASMNCWALPNAAFALLAEEFGAWIADGDESEFQLPTAITNLLERSAMRMMVRRTNGHWFGLTHPDDLPEVQRRLVALVEDKAYPAPLVAA